MDNKKLKRRVVCLGGGIGTVNLIKGLKEFVDKLTIVVSMADEGGSSGRLRRLYKILPPGDMVSCMAALSESKNPILPKLLTYRFPGDRYAKDEMLSGHKLGNLIFVAMRDITGSFDKATELFQKVFDIPGIFLPATFEEVSISAQTIDGKMIHGEENIDFGKYTGKRILEKVFLNPENPAVPEAVVKSLEQADVIIAGPGDLYTTILPVLIIPKISEIIKKSKAKKIFVVNVANKPFETKGYKVSDYIEAIIKHMGRFPFNTVVVNDNYSIRMPKKFHYDYVKYDEKANKTKNSSIVINHLVSHDFPIYHDSEKLAKTIVKLL